MQKPLALVLNTLLLATLALPTALAQPAAAPSSAKSFDVATIKPIPPGPPTNGWAGVQFHPDSIEFAWQSLPELLYFAFGYESARFDGQITGLPDWTDRQKYDIVAKISPADIDQYQHLSEAERQQWREQMMQSLLVDRFHLAFHRGTKQVPVYELIVAKGGIKMKDAATDPDPPLGKSDDGTPRQGIRSQRETSIVQAYSMAAWAEFLSEPETGVGRPVLDKTGLTGTYTFPFDWSIYSAQVAVHNGVAITNRAVGADPDDDGPSIFKALGEIGLKLQPATATMPTLVIDHVDQPSAN